MSQLPIIDEELLKNNYADLEVAGEPSFLGGLIARFLNSAPDQLNSIVNAIAAKDAHALQLQAHSFKGRAANLGAKALAEVCGKLEALGESGTIQGAVEHIPELTQQYKYVYEALAKKLDGIEDSL